MPPTIAGTPAPGTPGAKQMPKWAWPVAIGGGLIIGFFLLRKQPEEYDDESAEGGGELQGKKGGGGGAIPIPPEIREALGLEPPSTEYHGGGYGEPGSSDGGGDSTGDVSDPGVQTSMASTYQQQIQSLFYNPTTLASDSWKPTTHNPSTPVYTQAPAGSIPMPSTTPSAPAPSSGGAGNQSNVAS